MSNPITNFQQRQQIDSEETNNQIINSVPNEIWEYIFSYLDTKSLLSVSRTCKKWKAVLEDDNFWRQHFLRTFFHSRLSFPTMKEAVFTHFHWRKEIKFDPIFSYESNFGFELCAYIDEKRVLAKVNGFLKLFNLELSQIEDLFTYPVKEYEFDGEKIITISFDRKNCEAWSKEKGNILHFSCRDRHPIIFRSKQSYLSPDIGAFQDDLLDSLPIETVDFLNLNIQPNIYATYPEHDLLLIGFFPGRIQLYRAGKLIYDHHEESCKYVFHLSFVEGKIIAGYQDDFLHSSSFSEKKLIICDIETKQVVHRLSSVCIFSFQDTLLIYSNKEGDIRSLDLNTLSKQDIFIPKEGEGRKNFPNFSISKAVHQGSNLWVLCSNGKLYLHNLLTMKSIQLWESVSYGTAPTILDLFIVKNHLIAKIGTRQGHEINIFDIENVDNIKPVDKKNIGKGYKTLHFADSIVFNYGHSVKILRTIDLNDFICFENTSDCIVRDNQLIIAFNNGDILFFDITFNKIRSIPLNFPIEHMNVFQNYLFCIDKEGTISIYDIESGKLKLIFKKEKLCVSKKSRPSTSPKDPFPPISLSKNISSISEKERFEPFKISRTDGFVSEDALIISINHQFLLAVNLNSKKFLFEKAAFSDAIKFFSTKRGVFCLDHHNKKQALIQLDPLKIEGIKPANIKKYFNFGRFILILLSDGSIFVRDLESEESSYLNQNYDIKEPFSIKQVGQEKIIILCEKTRPILCNLSTGEEEDFDQSQVLFSWNFISSVAYLVFESGKIKSLNLVDEQYEEIDKELEGHHLTEIEFEGENIIIFYQQDSSDANANVRFIDLKNKKNSFSFTTMERGFQLENHTLLCETDNRSFLILEYSQDNFDYYSYHYKFLEIGGNIDNPLVFDSTFNSCYWVAHIGQFFLSIDENKAVYAHNIKSDDIIELLPSYSAEQRRLIEKQIFGDKVFIWFEEEEFYDSDGGGPPLAPACFVFDLNDCSFKSPKEGIYRNKTKLLVVDENQNYFLYDLNTLSLVLSSNTDCKFFHYDNVNDRVILGTNKSESLDEDFIDEKFSLYVWDAQEKNAKTLIQDQGKVFNIHCFKSKIYVWVTEESFDHFGEEKKLFILDTNSLKHEKFELTATLRKYSRIRDIISIENKVFILCSYGKLYYFNAENNSFSFFKSLDCSGINFLRNYLMLKSEKKMAVYKASESHS